jgi:predicted RecB family nuclease
MDYIRERVDYDADGVVRFTQPDLEALLREARMAHYRTTTEAAELGTIAHDYVEAFLRTGEEQDMAGQDPRVANCYDLFRRWWDQAGLSVIQTELMVYHAPLGYAGQLDFLAADKAGLPVLVDWKTSKSVYWNYHLQVVAYAKALREMGRGTVSAMRIVRIGREDADFEVREIPRSDWRRLGQLFEACIPLSDAFRDAERDYRKTRRKAGQEAA